MKLFKIGSKAIGLFSPLFTILFIISLITLATYHLSDKIDSLKAYGVGADAVVVAKSQWSKELERAEQKVFSQEALCNAIIITNDLVPQHFDVVDFSRIVEKTFEQELQKLISSHSIGLKSITPVRITAIPVIPDFRTKTEILFNPDYTDDNSRKKDVVIKVPTVHKFSIITNYNLTVIAKGRDLLKRQKEKCSLERTESTRTFCMKDLVKMSDDDNNWIVKSISEDSSLKPNEYFVEIISRSKPSWCDNYGRAKYKIILPEIY
ncbi:hypothetical protein HY483_00500 [Candidatus Woesearchaeota archaeon]|nr:hypothetical protein [Candidatus Woesearchaeota archaeon]